MPRNLTGQILIVTGASSGIGAATAIQCANAGMHLVLNARRADQLKQVAERVEASGQRVQCVVGDVAEPETSQRLIDAANDAFGRFDAVFANAGYGFGKPMIDVSEDELRQIFEVNFFAAVDLCQLAARQLIEHKRPGHLLMCSSCLSKFSAARYGPYTATKAAQDHICQAMHGELKQYNIAVSSVHPISTATEFFEKAAERSGQTSRQTIKPDERRGFLMQPPETVARAIVKCLRRPKREVWTSTLVRSAAALMTMFPSLHDPILRLGGVGRNE